MRHEKLVMAALLAASLMVVPVADAKKKKKAPTSSQPIAPWDANSQSQAGGLPATNARVAALEEAVVVLRGDLAAESAARQAADAVLANKLAMTPEVLVAEQSANLTSQTVTLASRALPAGTYFVLASIQMVNAGAVDAHARCVMRANGILLADTSDLEFPLLTTSPTPSKTGSTMFAPLQGTFGSGSPSTVDVQCTESNGGTLHVFARIAALKEGTGVVSVNPL